MVEKRVYTKLIELLRETREARALRQDEVAKYLGIYRQAISKIETGERRLTVVEFIRMCELYRLNIAAVARRLEKTHS